MLINCKFTIPINRKITPNLIIMPRMIYDYTKTELESVSFDSNLFKRSLKKAVRNLLPYEIDQLQNWLSYFTINKPELQNCYSEIFEDTKKGLC